jgi:hypothetical protein
MRLPYFPLRTLCAKTFHCIGKAAREKAVQGTSGVQVQQRLDFGAEGGGKHTHPCSFYPTCAPSPKPNVYILSI